MQQRQLCEVRSGLASRAYIEDAQLEIKTPGSECLISYHPSQPPHIPHVRAIHIRLLLGNQYTAGITAIGMALALP